MICIITLFPLLLVEHFQIGVNFVDIKCSNEQNNERACKAAKNYNTNVM